MDKLQFFIYSSILAASCLVSSIACAQTSSSNTSAGDWNGNWVADGTFFTIAVTINNDEIVVSEVESLGFVWTAKTGKVDGNLAAIEVTYLGATAMVAAELTGDGTAIAYAATCMPEFMVVCALANGRQAAFSRIEN